LGPYIDFLLFFFTVVDQRRTQHSPIQRRYQRVSENDHRNSLESDFTCFSFGINGTSSSIGNNNNSNNNNDNNDSNTDDHRTIKVFGFPSSLSDLIRTHFEKYGRIEESRYSPGNWLIIRYASPSSAASALKSNGMVLVDTFIIGVTAAPTQIPLAQQPSVATTSTNSFISIIPTDDNGKNDKLVTLGSGKAGMSVVGCPTINPTGAAVIPQTTGWIGFIKDALFAW
jgi:hypothetical protein